MAQPFRYDKATLKLGLFHIHRVQELDGRTQKF